MVIAQNWYNLNAGRQYPLDDAASGESDAGLSIPDDILLDANIRFPASAGHYAYLGALHVSEHLISAVIMATYVPAALGREVRAWPIKRASNLAAGSGLPPDYDPTKYPDTVIASVSFPRTELQPGRQVLITPIYPGSGGWLVFGPCKNYFTGKFAEAVQSMLAPRVARSYTGLPIKSLSKQHNATALTGLVKLRAGNDIEISHEQREIAGKLRNAIVFRLAEQTGRKVLAEYTGPCGGRPDSGTCLKPPIEAINAAIPDCDGNINIIFPSPCAAVGYEASSDPGIVVDYCLGLSSACLPDDLPVDGNLRQFDDLCLQPSLPQHSSTAHIIPPGPSSSSPAPTQSSSPCPPLPKMETFVSGPGSFHVVNGSYVVNGGFYQATNEMARNLAIWDDCAYDNIQHKLISARVQLMSGKVTTNAGVLIGYADRQSTSSGLTTVHAEYLAVEVDKRRDAFRVLFWTGLHYIVLAELSPMSLQNDHTYKITVTTMPTSATATVVDCTLYDDVSGQKLANTQVTSAKLSGSRKMYCGVHVRESMAKFDTFFVSNYP